MEVPTPTITWLVWCVCVCKTLLKRGLSETKLWYRWSLRPPHELISVQGKEPDPADQKVDWDQNPFSRYDHGYRLWNGTRLSDIARSNAFYFPSIAISTGDVLSILGPFLRMFNRSWPASTNVVCALIIVWLVASCWCNPGDLM